jgi:hypothetical protein
VALASSIWSPPLEDRVGLDVSPKVHDDHRHTVDRAPRGGPATHHPGEPTSHNAYHARTRARARMPSVMAWSRRSGPRPQHRRDAGAVVEAGWRWDWGGSVEALMIVSDSTQCIEQRQNRPDEPADGKHLVRLSGSASNRPKNDAYRSQKARPPPPQALHRNGSESASPSPEGRGGQGVRPPPPPADLIPPPEPDTLRPERPRVSSL